MITSVTTTFWLQIWYLITISKSDEENLNCNIKKINLLITIISIQATKTVDEEQNYLQKTTTTIKVMTAYLKNIMQCVYIQNIYK